MYHRILATLALSFVFYIGSSQISYHRLYETTLNDQMGMNDTTFFHMSSTTLSGDVYAMGTKRVGASTEDFEDLSIIFTKHNDKGNVDWSKELDLGQDTVKLFNSGGTGDFTFNNTEDSILFTISVEINGDRSEIFGRLATNGNEIDLKTVGGLIFSGDNEFPKATPFINFSDLLVTTAEQPIINRIGLGEDLLWSREYTFTNSDGDSLFDRITDITTAEDSTIVLTGKSDEISNDFMVAKLDTNGVQLWAESYTLSIANLVNILPVAIQPLTNGNIAVAGRYITTDVLGANGFVSMIDTSGSILSTKKVFITEAITGISNLTEGADGTIWMSGEYGFEDSIKYFTTNMNIDGTINWTTIYPGQEAGFGPSATSLLNVQSTGGATLVGHGFLDDIPVMQVMKHDVDGTTPCSDTITIIVEDLITVEDTLTSQVVNGGIFFDSIAYELNNFTGFSPPTLTIDRQYAPFCPNEIIDTLLVAIVDRVAPENITYLWSTEEINDSINVIMEGQYSVTVTITEDVCYSMCDTIELTRLTLPQIDISQDNSRFCLEGIIVLTGNYTPGASNQTFLWNTEETTQSIEVDEAGVYSVTVTDECGEIASDDLDASLPEFDPSVFFGANTNDFCETGSAIITAAYSGGGNEPVYNWSDGQTGNPIVVTIEDTYTVTVTDECGFTTIETGEVVFPIIATEATIEVTPECNEKNPQASTVTFEAIGDGDLEILAYTADDAGIQTLISQTNPTVPALNIFDLMDSEFNRFVVFATNACGEVLDSLAVNGSALCSPLQYPIVFFPGGQDEASTTFGAIPLDTLDLDRISDVEFKVFNRWGETVFESTEILDAWDGTHKGEPAPSEVYIWYLTYFIDGREILDKGDVTLIR